MLPRSNICYIAIGIMVVILQAENYPKFNK